MAIRVSHANAEDIGKLGLEAGRGEQKVTQQAQQLQVDLQAQADAARIDAANINANTAITKAVMDANNMREMAQFDSFMRAESQRRQIAWEVEKVELRQRHDFDLNTQRKDLESQMVLENKMIEDQELQTKKKALKKEVDNHGISPDRYRELLLGLELGADMGRTLSGPGGEAGFMAQESERAKVNKIRADAERSKPENVAMRTADILQQVSQVLPDLDRLDPDTAKQTRELMRRPDLPEAAAQAILDTVQAKVKVLQKEKRLGLVGGFAFGP